MAPRVPPRALPAEAAQQATNCRLDAGDLEAWNRPELVKALTLDGAGPVRTLYRYGALWLSFEDEVELALGPQLSDDTTRLYITGLDVPRFTTPTLAAGAEPLPAITRPLGVPGPDEAATLTLAPGTTTTGNVVITNPGAETGDDTGWTQITPDLDVFTNGDAGASGMVAHEGSRFFYGGNNASGEYEQAIDLDTAGLVTGQTLTLTWQQASGANASTAAMGLRFFDGTSALVEETLADLEAITPANTWQQRSVTAVVPADAVSVRLVMLFGNVGGATTDAYLDTITLDSALADYTSDGSTLSGWTVSPNNGGTTNGREVAIVAAGGAHGDVIEMSADEMFAYVYRDAAFNRAASFEVTVEARMNSSYCRGSILLGTSSGIGQGITFSDSSIGINQYTGLEASESESESIASWAVPDDSWLRFSIVGARAAAGVYDVTVTVENLTSGATLVDAYEAQITVTGTEFGLRYFSNRDSGGQRLQWDNVRVSITPQAVTTETDTTLTAYVWRYVNDFGEASAPATPTRTIQRADGVQVTVTTPTTLSSGADGYGITTKQIFRAATGSTGTVFRFVAEIPLATADYVDTLTDAELGEVLDSDDWDLPPSDLRYILALPNGIMCGASGNELCFSVQSRPHAWPVAYRIPADSPITGLANVDNVVVVGTETFVHTASGTAPDSYTMSKPGAPHACLAHRSFVYLLGVGALFAGPDGFMAVSGATQVTNATANLFTRDQWQALDPSTMLAEIHDELVFLWHGGDVPGGIILDVKGAGTGGVTELAMHATAAYRDPEADALFVVLDAYAEPTAPALPAADVLDDVDGAHVFEWNAAAELMRYQWRGRLWLLPHPMALQWARVRRVADGGTLALEVDTDVGNVHDATVTTSAPFRLDATEDYDELELTLTGTARVRTVQAADDVLELE